MKSRHSRDPQRTQLAAHRGSEGYETTIVTTLFGYVCNQAKRLPEAIAPVRDALSMSGPVARWGLAYVQAGHVLLSRNPRGEAGGVDFAAAIDKLQSDYIVGWTTGDDGLKGTPNTQPFRYRSWLYAQTGSQTPFDPKPLLEHMPGYLQRNIRGKTAAEHHFHLLLSLLHDSGKLNDPDAHADVIRFALRDTVALVGRLVEGSANEHFGNVVACNSRCMVVAHFGGAPLFIRHLRNEDRRLSENQRYRAVLAVSADTKPGDGFEAIPVGSALVVHRTVETEIQPVVA